MKTGKSFVRIALSLALVISMVAALSVGAFARDYSEDGCDIRINTTVGGSVTSNYYEEVIVGDTVTLTVTPSDGYELSSLSVTDANHNAITTTAGAANTYTFRMPGYDVTVSAVFSPVAYLDTTTTTTQTVNQNYDLTVGTSTYADVTKVKVEWSTTDITASRTDNKTWNPSTLTWDDTTTANTVTVSQNGGATFTLTNLSSVQVSAAVTFTKVSTFSDPTVAFTVDNASSTNGETTIGTVVNNDKTVTTDNDHDAVIGVSVTPVADDFKALAAAADAQFGTYTVTISEVSTVS